MSDMVDFEFTDATLAKVVTLTEAQYLFKLSKKTLLYAIWNDNISARKAVTGGNWLITWDSLVKRYGEPARQIKELLI